MYNIKTRMIGEKFSNNRTLNLKAMGNGKGVRHLTIRNTGTSDLIVNDDAVETIPPNSTFVINSIFLITNESLELIFSGVGTKEAIVRYLVDVEDKQKC